MHHKKSNRNWKYRNSGNFRVRKFSCDKFSRESIFVVCGNHENISTTKILRVIYIKSMPEPSRTGLPRFDLQGKHCYVSTRSTTPLPLYFSNVRSLNRSYGCFAYDSLQLSWKVPCCCSHTVLWSVPSSGSAIPGTVTVVCATFQSDGDGFSFSLTSTSESKAACNSWFTRAIAWRGTADEWASGVR